MELGRMVSLVIVVTVSIILFVAILMPVITEATSSGALAADGDFATWGTLIAVCGTLTIIAILMIVVRNLGRQ